LPVLFLRRRTPPSVYELEVTRRCSAPPPPPPGCNDVKVEREEEEEEDRNREACVLVGSKADSAKKVTAATRHAATA
jgi:hypothetical protein